jgi:hypothetical protein
LKESTNGIGRIIKSGITGALGLSSFFIIFTIILALSGTHFSRIYQELLTRFALSFVIAMIAGVGFIIGITVRRHFPVVEKGFLPMIVAAAPLTIGLWLIWQYASRVEFPHKTKISEYANGAFTFRLNDPKGRYYVLKLSAPGIEIAPNGESRSSYVFSGDVTISNITGSVKTFRIDSEKASLSSEGFILSGGGVGNTNLPALDTYIQSHQDYEIRVMLSPPPPPSSALWLYWQQTSKDSHGR